MPMDFPDFNSLRNCAALHEFRSPHDGESEDSFRDALADHVQSRDIVESMEIRAKVGWDKFNKSQNNEMLLRAMQQPNPAPSDQPPLAGSEGSAGIQ